MEEHEFKPKQWVLVRDTDEQKWRLGIYSHYDEDSICPYRLVGTSAMECIPYEGNECLIGTNNPAGAVKELDGWKVGDKVEVQYCRDGKWHEGTIEAIDPSKNASCDGEKMPYLVKAPCFLMKKAWCAKSQLRKASGRKAEDELFKFGDYVEVLENGEWIIGIVTEVDEDDEYAVYHVNFPEDEGWYRKSEVRKHEKEG